MEVATGQRGSAPGWQERRGTGQGEDEEARAATGLGGRGSNWLGTVAAGCAGMGGASEEGGGRERRRGVDWVGAATAAAIGGGGWARIGESTGV